MASGSTPATSFQLKVGAANIKTSNGPVEKRTFPPGLSDGRRETWPSASYRPSVDENYRRKLGQSWAEHDGSARPGVNYVLDSLPDGYATLETNQHGGGPQIYKRLFGHPSGKFYDSIPRFAVHFFWLLDGKPGLCQCILCGNHKPASAAAAKPRHKLGIDLADGSILKKRTAPRPDRPSSNPSDDEADSSRSASTGAVVDRSRRAARGVLEAWPIDREGTKNVYKEAVAHAFKARESKYGLDIDIEEKDSIDWVGEHEILAEYITKIDQQHSFVPRLGELVLWAPTSPPDSYLLLNPNTQQYEVYIYKQKNFIGLPRWRAGVITSVPSNTSKNGPIDFPDLLDTPKKKSELNTSGFRVETMVDPNNDQDKSAAKQYRYVPLKQIRPFSHWQALLNGIPQNLLHPSISHAMTCMTSISLVDKFKFKGDWKAGGYFKARGAYLGPEFITVGDTIRLLPQKSGQACTDILVVNEIKLRISGLKEQHQESNTPIICSEHYVTFAGQAYTCDIRRALRDADPFTASQITLPRELSAEDVKYKFRPVGTSEYGAWWPLHSTIQKLEVSYDQVLGRLYEADAIRLWSGQLQYKWPTDEREKIMQPRLDLDLAGVMSGRRFATSHDQRIPDAEHGEIRWLISDTRARSLTLATVNGLETADYHPIRTKATLAQWRLHIRRANGENIPSDLLGEQSKKSRSRPNYYYGVGSAEFAAAVGEGGKRRGRPPGSKLIDGKIVTAEMLAKMDPAFLNSRAVENADSTGAEDTADDDQNASRRGKSQQDAPEIPETQTQTQTQISKRHSQMAGAALVSTDEDDIGGRSGSSTADDDDDDENDYPNDEEMPDAHPRPLQSRLAQYGAPSTDTDPSRPQKPPTPQQSTKPRPAPPSKSQIMGSIEADSQATLGYVSEDGYDSDQDEDEEEWDSQKLAEWKDPRNARGGTEETEGGDYQPD